MARITAKYDVCARCRRRIYEPKTYSGRPLVDLSSKVRWRWCRCGRPLSVVALRKEGRP